MATSLSSMLQSQAQECVYEGVCLDGVGPGVDACTSAAQEAAMVTIWCSY